jgi:CSLREA domain-containing protein
MVAPQLARMTRLASLVALLMAGLFHPQPAQAATFLVVTTQDAPHTTPIDGNCTSTLAGNPCTLRAAIQAVNFLGGGPHTTNLAAAGGYILTVTGTDEDNAATGDLDNNGASITINNISGGTVLIDGNRADRVFDVGPLAAARPTLIGLTVQNGAATAPAPPPANGGGILVRAGSSLALNSARVTTSIAVGNGGGIANFGSISIVGTLIDQNTLGVVGKGAGFYNAGTYSPAR